ncbi:hypothetical protein GCM10009721_40560 [Terrabacter tumescens]|uniref:CBS domain-containing protein n=1 Tax=Terrabacter tumescens TaxID=60443 RepID=A0ABQ2IFV5_9MICO|nr:hypothetical protein [Terrabacter tumescens]GGN08587.1 hypothetical protein GCM10009721_40560 [Terrabacter tumescens]
MPQEPVHELDGQVRRWGRLRRVPSLDLEALPPDVRAAVDAMLAGQEVTLRRDGREIGVLVHRPSVLVGTVVGGLEPGRGDGDPEEAAPRVPEGAMVVATATKLSKAARQRLSDELGAGYVVLDLLKAPTSADVVLTHPVSPQLLGSLRMMFPDARIIVTEIEDDELGVSAPGPVSRLLDAGASAYLPPRPLREVAANVHAYLTGSGAPQLTAGSSAPGPVALPWAPTDGVGTQP